MRKDRFTARCCALCLQAGCHPALQLCGSQLGTRRYSEEYESEQQLLSLAARFPASPDITARDLTGIPAVEHDGAVSFMVRGLVQEFLARHTA